MYQSFFGLTCEPFSVAADPRFIYRSPAHRQALAHLKFGLHRGTGFILLTGEIGAGKTTVCRSFIRRLNPVFDVALVVNPRLDARALLARACEDLRIELQAGTVDLIDAIHGHLLLSHAAGRRTLIVVDEAQALSLDVLEQLRLLTNLDSSGGKLQVFLIGQPELRTMLQQPALEPVAQRVVARFHLSALPERETALYIAHRLSVAGLFGPLPFDEAALHRIHHLCAGVPRRINVLCGRVMHVAEEAAIRTITQEMVEEAAHEVFDDPPKAEVVDDMPQATTAPTVPTESEPRWPALLGVAGSALLIGALAVWTLNGHGSPPTPPSIAAASPTTTPTAAAPTPVSVPVPVPAPAPSPAPVSMSTTRVVAASLAAAASPPAAKPVPFDRIETFFATAEPDESVAWRNLARLWGAALGPSPPCDAAASAGLRCYRTSGGLETVRQLDRPGLLKLTNEQGRVVYALLVGLSDSGATIRSGDTEMVLPLSALAGRWHGEFATLWRSPPGYRIGGSIGAGNAFSDWLGERLSIVDGASPNANDGESLAARVSVFQLAHGLEPDGRVGPQTMMQLNHASSVGEPRLLAER
jgi:general secretion pathway protein A